MRIFVESWEPILIHAGTQSESQGKIGMVMDHGQVVPYKKTLPQLYIHYLEVGTIDRSDLVPFNDVKTNFVTDKRLSLPNAKWWLSTGPKAFAIWPDESGQRYRATLTQLARPCTVL